MKGDWVVMANLDSGSDEEFEGFPVETNQSVKARRELIKKALESIEDDDDDDVDDIKGPGKSSERKRKALEAFESNEDDSGSDEDEGSSDDDDTEDDEDNDDDEEDIDNEGEDALDIDLNEDDDDIPTNSDQCPICLMSLGGQKLGTPSECQHVFCLACILEWSKNANTCPVDRKVFHEILVHSTKKGPILQQIPVEDRRVPDVGWEQEPTFCEVCNECDREDRMLLCDGCDKGYHLECLRPRLYTVPAGSWYCTTCLEIRRNEQLEEDEESVPELLPGTVRRSRHTTRNSARSEEREMSEADTSHRARTAATNRRRSTSTRGRGRGRGRGRTGSRSSGRGRSRSRTTGRSRTGSSTRRGRGGKKKTRKRAGKTSATGRPKRKKRKRTSTKKKRSTTTRPKAKKRKVDEEETYRNPFEAQSSRGRTPKERLSNSLRASGSNVDTGRGLGMISGLSILGDNYALDYFEDDNTNEPENEQSDSSSVKSANSDVLGSIFDGLDTLHDQNATVSRDGRVLPSESQDKHSPNKANQKKSNESSSNASPRENSDVISLPREQNQNKYHGHEMSGMCDNGESLPPMHDGKSRGSADVTKCSCDQGNSGDLKNDNEAGTSVKSTNANASQKSLIKEERKDVNKEANFQATSEKNVVLDSKNLDNKTESRSADQAGNFLLESKHLKETPTNNSAASSIREKSLTPTLKIEREDSSKPASNPLSSAQVSISASSCSSSKCSLEQPISSASGTPTRFRIPKKNDSLLEPSRSKESLASGSSPNKSPSPLSSKSSKKNDSLRKPSSSKDSLSPGSSSNDSPSPLSSKSSKKNNSLREPSSSKDSLSPGSSPNKSPSPLSSKSSNPISNSNTSISKKLIPTGNDSSVATGSESSVGTTNKDSCQSKVVSPILLTDKKCQNEKQLSKFKETSVSSQAVVPKASSPRALSLMSKDNDLDSSNEKKIILSNDSRKDAGPSVGDSKEKHVKIINKFDGKKSDLAGVSSDYSHRSAFAPVTKNKDDVIKNKKEAVETYIESTNKPTRFGNKSPSIQSKPSLLQLPTSMRSSSPSSKRLGSRPSTGLTGFKNCGLSREAETRSSGHKARVIKYSDKKGELKVIVSGKEETHTALRSLSEETHPALRSVPEESRPALRSLPEETHPALRSFSPTSSSVEPYQPPLNTVQPSLSTSLKPLKPVTKRLSRPKLKMLSTSETTSPSGTLPSGVVSSRDFPNRTNQNLAIIQMLRHKTSTLRAEVELGHSLLRQELESSGRETPEPIAESSDRSYSTSPVASKFPYESQRHTNFNRPKLSSLLGPPRSSTPPVAIVRPSSYSFVNENFKADSTGGPSVSFAGFADIRASENFVSGDMESERERNRKKGIARLQRMERIKNNVKASLQPYYNHNEISKQDFKEIFIRAVKKIQDSNHEVDRHCIASLVKKYVKMFKGLRFTKTNHSSDL